MTSQTVLWRRSYGVAAWLLVLAMPAIGATDAQRPVSCDGRGVTAPARTTTLQSNSTCEVQTRLFALDFLHSGELEATTQFEFCAPISLDEATAIVLETLITDVTSTSSASHSFTLNVQLLSAGDPVVDLPSISGFQSGSITSQRNYSLVVTDDIPAGIAIDGIRLTSTVTSTTLSIRYRGAYANDFSRIRIARGPLGEGTCHESVDLPGIASFNIVGAGTSEWFEQTFDQPIDATDLNFVIARNHGFSITGAGSFDIEAQLILDDETVLQMDNWSSPGEAGPPDGTRIWARVARLGIDYPECTALDDRAVVGWRWRIHKNGSGTLTINPADPMTLWFLNRDCAKIGDLNGDGVVDGADLLLLLQAWGPCPDPMDCPADMDGNCAVDGADLLILLQNWG